MTAEHDHDDNVIEFPDDPLNRAIDRVVREMERIDVRDDPEGAAHMVDCLTRLEALTTASNNRLHALGYSMAKRPEQIAALEQRIRDLKKGDGDERH